MPTRNRGEAITAAAYLINRLPSSTLQFQTPLSVLHDAIKSPTVLNLLPKVFGCTTFVHLHKPLRNKLETQAIKCVFVGYAQHQKGYRCYHPSTHKLYVTLNVLFHEDKMYYSTSEMINDKDNQGNLQAPKDNMYYLDAISEKYYTEPQS
jgi:hypothetical protein